MGWWVSVPRPTRHQLTLRCVTSGCLEAAGNDGYEGGVEQAEAIDLHSPASLMCVVGHTGGVPPDSALPQAVNDCAPEAASPASVTSKVSSSIGHK
jgi:hypothetical protein